MSRYSVVPFGPQHAAFLEPLHIKLSLEEEKVTAADIVIGYNHRGMEHALSLDHKKSMYLVERICGICSFHHSSAYAQTIESIYGLDVPVRAKVIRTIMMEMQRLTSHLLALGHIAEAVGYENLFMQCFRERELIMGLVNMLSGNRVHYSMNCARRSQKGPDRRAMQNDGDHDRGPGTKVRGAEKSILEGQYLPQSVPSE